MNPCTVISARVFCLSRFLVGFAVGIGCFATVARALSKGDTAEIQAILQRIVAPTFPDRAFPITQYGGVADGKTDCRDAFVRAIAACSAAGGGRVEVPAGDFFCDGPIHLASKVNLHLSAGATLKFGADPARYLPAVLTRFEGTMLYGHSPRIYARGATDVAITGGGVIDGNARETLALMKDAPGRGGSGTLRKMGATGVPVEERVFGEGKWLRPSMVQLIECTNVLVEGVTVKDSTFWCLHPVLCRNVTVRGVTVDSWNGNNDGCDPDSCRDVLIEDCRFRAGDDAIAIKSGRDQDGWAVGRLSENIVIRRVAMESRHGAICIGSEMSGGVRNVYVQDCTATSVSNGLYFKANLDRGGLVEHVRVERLTVDKVRDSAVRFETSYPGYRGEKHPPSFKDFVLEDVLCHESGGYGIYLEGVEDAPIRDVTLRRVTVEKARDPAWIKLVERLVFDAVKVNGTLVRPDPVPANATKRKVGS
jgi:polygalacturonase